MAKLTYNDLLDAGVHFGHLTRKWDPRMAPFIFMERNGIHIIDLNKTLACLDEASNAIRTVVRSGRKVMFVATKKQAKNIVEEEAVRLKMPYVTERWLGGMLTNFATIRKSLKKLSSIERLQKDESYLNLAKRERLMISREKDKLEKVLGGISDLTRLPAAIFVVDVKKEHIAVKEAQKLNIPIFAIVDTNSDPNVADFPIPANDDAYKSIDIIVRNLAKAVEEGLLERKRDKEDQKLREEEETKRRIDEGGEEVEEVMPASETRRSHADKDKKEVIKEADKNEVKAETESKSDEKEVKKAEEDKEETKEVKAEKTAEKAEGEKEIKAEKTEDKKEETKEVKAEKKEETKEVNAEKAEEKKEESNESKAEKAEVKEEEVEAKSSEEK
jgi:small subunit ribosomal protein S2